MLTRPSEVYAIELWREGWTESQCIYSGDFWDEAVESELNQFLSDWLDDISQSGFEQMEPRDDGICPDMNGMDF